MAHDADILDRIRRDPDLAELLREACEFDATRGEHGEAVHLSNGSPLEAVAGDFSGGTFFLCGESRAPRPVLYVSSEGRAGLVGDSLTGALEVMVGLPSWSDCLKFSGGGDLASMTEACTHLERGRLAEQPEVTDRRIHIARSLSLDLATVPVLLDRLHDVVNRTGPGFVLNDTGGLYQPLFGDHRPQDNPTWR